MVQNHPFALATQNDQREAIRATAYREGELLTMSIIMEFPQSFELAISHSVPQKQHRANLMH